MPRFAAGVFQSTLSQCFFINIRSRIIEKKWYADIYWAVIFMMKIYVGNMLFRGRMEHTIILIWGVT